jgi:hypothetical protein
VYFRLFVLVLVIDRSCRVSVYGSITSTAPHGGTEQERDSADNGTKADLPMKYHQFIADLEPEQIYLTLLLDWS